MMGARSRARMRRAAYILAGVLALLAAVVGAFVWTLPFLWDAVVPGEAACLARVRGDGEMALPSDIEPTALSAAAEEVLQQQGVGLRRDWLLEARPIPSGWADAWCEIAPLQAEPGQAPLEPTGNGWYARTEALVALTVAEARGMRGMSQSGQPARALSLTDAFAMEYAEASDASITADGSAETVLRRQWTRDPGTIGVSIYHSDKGVPHWLFAKVLWPVLWCDPVVRVRAQQHGRPRAQIVAFQPPFWPMGYEWDGRQFALVGVTRANALDLTSVVLWSYRRWLTLVSAMVALAAVAEVLRRRRGKRETV
jgi:hypothetical protein